MRIGILEIGRIRQLIKDEQGFTLIDVLVATAIVGMVAVTVWRGQSSNYATLSRVNEQVHMIVAGTTILVELECGSERKDEGILSTLRHSRPVQWRFSSTDNVLEVKWVAREQNTAYQLPGFFVSP